MKLEWSSFLACGLVLFGDNAHISSSHMVAPFKGVSSGPEDAFNCFHSSTRIEIECAFGMLVHRWGLLRKPIPLNVTLEKTTALVHCLCKLHNFCIDENEGPALQNMDQDAAEINRNGGVPLDDAHGNPSQLLNSGHHFNDVSRNHRRQMVRNQPNELPRDRLFAKVVENDHRRPQILWLQMLKFSICF